ncbi:UDP-N-acetylglucosamine 1-carboxyvinyltransferase [bacterium]|nr:UDP-N-acetylglucosamine 1-carboxyvinyltransferase [bacterium]
MDKLVVNGPNRLCGELTVSGSKNAALPIVFASLMAEGVHTINNVPRLADMDSAQRMLLCFGAEIDQNMKSQFGANWVVDTRNIKSGEAPYDLVRKMRASFFSLGPLLARRGEARVSLPGGCAIGARPVDLHLNAFEALGAKVEQEAGYVTVRAKDGKLPGGKYVFPFVSVGATENVMMAATLSKGECVLENAAREPEVFYLAEVLNSMGAKISGHGTSTITISGVDRLEPMNFTIPPDRIEAATYLIAAHMTGGSITLHNAPVVDLGAVLAALAESGAEYGIEENIIQLESSGDILPVSIKTEAYPGFPTDVQAQWCALMTQANGVSTVEETIFENRFMHVPELIRMGANIKIDGNKLTIKAKKSALTGAPVMATDLRASASLVLAALVAEGSSEVLRIYHLDRGYESMELKLRSLGARVERV